MTAVTTIAPTAQELKDLYFANKIVKHTKSNTIVFVKNDQLLSSGVGQTSRVDALKQAIVKADAFKFDLKGSVMASDAFFPSQIVLKSLLKQELKLFYNQVAL